MRRKAPLRKRGESVGDALWRDARQATLERDHYECQAPDRGLGGPWECEGILHVHHILPRGRGGMHHPANLVTLCGHHHEDVHTHPEHSYRLGLLQRSGDAECANCHHVSRLHSITYGTCTFGAFGLECSCRAFQEAA
jgi:5-methylcytosine-specific restriction endonuclease McrA